jgi:hypothetical protein
VHRNGTVGFIGWLDPLVISEHLPKPVDRKSNDAKGNNQDRPNNLRVLLSMRQPELEKQNEEAEPKIIAVNNKNLRRQGQPSQVGRREEKYQKWRGKADRCEIDQLHPAQSHRSNETELSDRERKRVLLSLHPS